jgi:hypothetical protein
VYNPREAHATANQRVERCTHADILSHTFNVPGRSSLADILVLDASQSEQIGRYVGNILGQDGEQQGCPLTVKRQLFDGGSVLNGVQDCERASADFLLYGQRRKHSRGECLAFISTIMRSTREAVDTDSRRWR